MSIPNELFGLENSTRFWVLFQTGSGNQQPATDITLPNDMFYWVYALLTNMRLFPIVRITLYSTSKRLIICIVC